MLPLYNEFQLKKSEANPGLLFDKFPAGWAHRWHAKLPDGAKENFFNKFTGMNYCHLKKDLQSYLERQEQLVCQLCGSDTSPLLYLKTDWRFISGLGSGHPYETGFIWHRTLGVPYLPGSSVKGMIRAWAEQWCNKEECDMDTVRRLFGSESLKDEPGSGKAGSLIIFDALPIRPPKLELDILNPHYQPYYESNGAKPPADYYNPVPVFFLTVAPDQSFRFCLAPRQGVQTEDAAVDVTRGYELLEEALKILGAGGKTAVGYGSFKEAPEEIARVKQRRLRDKLQNMPKEECWRLELIDKGSESLVNPLSRNWGKTKKYYGNDLELYLAIIREVHGAVIREWRDSEKKNEKKAYKNVFPST